MSKPPSVPEQIQSLILELKDSRLADIRLDPMALSVDLEFALGPGASNRKVMVELSDTVQVSISRTPNEESGSWYVFEATLDPLEDGGRRVLAALGHGFRKSLEEMDSPFTYPEVKLFHFHLEGEVCLDVVCTEYRVTAS